MKGIEGYMVSTGYDRNVGVNRLWIEVVVSGHNGGYINFNFQQNEDGKDWYGCKIEIHTEKIETIQRSLRIAKKVNIGFYTQPEEVIKSLEELKIQEVCYHPGKNEYFTEKNWPQGKTYMITLNSDCLFTVIANNEEDAIEKGIKRIAKNIDGCPYSSETWKKWLKEQTVKLIEDEKLFQKYEIEEKEKEEDLVAI